jgi:hypothetical protein
MSFSNIPEQTGLTVAMPFIYQKVNQVNDV